MREYKPPRVYLHHGLTGARTHEIVDPAFVQFEHNETEPASASLGVARNSGYLDIDVLAPGGAPAFVWIDARDLGDDRNGDAFGIPEVWGGHVKAPQGQISAGSWTIQATGRSATMGRDFTVRPAQEVRLPASQLAALLTTTFPSMRVRMGGQRFEGRGVPISPGGQTVWSLLESLAKDRGERFTLEADPDEVGWWLNWRSALDVRERRDVELTYTDAFSNCVPDVSYDLDVPAAAIVGASWSLLKGAGLESFALKAPAGRFLGRQTALTAVLSSPLAQALSGAATASLRPDLTSREAMERAMVSELRAALAPKMPARVSITDVTAALYSLRPGDVVPTRWDDEPTGVYRRGMALVLQRTVQVAPTLKLDLAVDLWSTEVV